METGTEAYLLSQIVALSNDLDMMHTISDTALPCGLGFLIGGVSVFAVSYAVSRGRDYLTSSLYWAGMASLISIWIGAIVLMANWAVSCDIPHIQTELDSLVSIYEQLYGPLPEGLI